MDDLKLRQRHESEVDFHNIKYTKENTSPKHYEFGPTYTVFKKMKRILGNLEGKKVLEYGCGNGWMTVELAAMEADLYTFDISDAAVQSTRELLERKGYSSRVNVRQMAAEELKYKDGQFDVIFGFAILHHLDLDRALSELSRVLKPGGIAIFAEPLQGNPALKIYRRMTPQYRTPDEEPINIESFSKKVEKIGDFKYQSIYFLSLFAFLFIYLPKLSFLYYPVVKVLMVVDDYIFKFLPFSKRYAWYSILQVEKGVL